jgi:hypothetical protein
LNTSRRFGFPPGALVGVSRWRPSGDGLTRLVTFLLTVAAALLLWFAFTTRTPEEAPPTHLSLVIEDGGSTDDPHIRVWRDAADELGFALKVVSASTLMRQSAWQRDAALIVPDSIHRHINEPLWAHLRARVQEGAKLMLVYDAGLANLQGELSRSSSATVSAATAPGAVGSSAKGSLKSPAAGRAAAAAPATLWNGASPLGLRYATTGPQQAPRPGQHTVWVPPPAVDLLQLPPGMLLREGSRAVLTTPQTTPQVTERLPLAGAMVNNANGVAVTGPHVVQAFATQGRFDGQLLLGGDDDTVLAGSRVLGRGAVLLVNLPLAAMKLQSQGFLLHTLLRHFAQDMAQLAQLSPLPDARGALVLNWQIDSPAEAPAMAQLAKMGALDLGKLSVHFGPGAGLGTNEALRDWLRRFSQREDEIGSHETEGAAAAQSLDDHLKEVRVSSGRPVREQSLHIAASLGAPAALAGPRSGSAAGSGSGQLPSANHPGERLVQQGILAYRTRADVGAAATRAYVQGQRGPGPLWAFPALGFGGATSFEQARASDAAESDVGAWLDDVMSYCAEQRVLRVLDIHPSAAMQFPQAFERWTEHVQALAKDDRLRVTTLSSHAAFANQRLAVSWQVRFEQGRLRLQASHPTTLAHMSWLLPAQGFEAPQMQEGSARVERVGPYWRVTADAVRQLVVTTAPLKSDTRPEAR